MTLDSLEIKERKDSILGIAVEEYIQTILPVSSSFIAGRYLLDLSSATIRNILAELEEDGYLIQPHASAGRIPTEKGYRYYVDNLMNEIKLLEEEKRRIKEEYNREKLELEQLLDKTSRCLSELTHYTGIVSVDGWNHKFFCRGTNLIIDYPDYPKDLNKIKNILTALDQKESLLKVINKNLAGRIDILIGHEITCREIESCSLVVSSYKLKDGLSGRMAVLGPTRMDYERVVSALDYFSQLMEEMF